MENIIIWIENNKEWFLSGLGVFIFGLVITVFTKNKNNKKNGQRIGNNSHGIQAGGDVIIGGGKSSGTKDRK